MTENNTTVLYKNNTTVLENISSVVLNVSMKFSERVKQARQFAKLSQEELALAVGLTQGLISKIERGDQEETASVVKIAKVCGVRPEWLDDESGEMIDGLYVEGEKLKNAFIIMQSLPEYALDEAIERVIAVKKFCEMAETANTKK